MNNRVAARLELNLALRQTEDPSVNLASRWFYIVDLEPRAEESPHALRDGRVVLGFSTAEADADAATDADGLGVVYYTDLDETDQRNMVARVETSPHDGPERNEMPKPGEGDPIAS